MPPEGKTWRVKNDDPWDDCWLLKKVHDGCKEDPLIWIILAKPEEHSKYFRVKDGLAWTKNFRQQEVLCIPRQKELITALLTRAHEIMGHYGAQRTLEYLQRWYWWPQMAKTVHRFCQSCDACQRAKTLNQRPAGKLHPLPLPIKPWDSIAMDFVGPFPESRGMNYLWVILCRMTSMVHLIPLTTKVTATELSWKYL